MPPLSTQRYFSSRFSPLRPGLGHVLQPGPRYASYQGLHRAVAACDAAAEGVGIATMPSTERPSRSVALAGRHVLSWRVREDRERAPAGPGTGRAFARLAVGSALEALDLANDLAIRALWLLPPLDAEVGDLLAGEGPGVGPEAAGCLLRRRTAGWRVSRTEVGVRLAEGSPRPAGRVLLAGFMGAGKSTVGPALAARLGWGFVDTDRIVEDEARCPLVDLFVREGEEGFRARERRAVARALEGERTVVALGGGALDDPSSRRRVAGAGTTVLLWAPLPVLLTRASDGARPLLDGRLHPAVLLTRRRAAYLEAADLVLSTAKDEPAEVATRLEDELLAGRRLP